MSNGDGVNASSATFFSNTSNSDGSLIAAPPVGAHAQAGFFPDGNPYYVDGVDAYSEVGRGIYAEGEIGVHAVGGGVTNPTNPPDEPGGSSNPPLGQYAVFAEGGSGYGVYATSDSGGTGVSAISDSGTGVYAQSENFAVTAFGGDGIGVFAYAGGSNGTSVIGAANGGNSGYFTGGTVEVYGTLDVIGTLMKPGGAFKIDHPLDPANKYLYHSFVESSEMKNIYDGVVTLDSNGEMEVELPAWFEALNRDFRYQLTPLGAPAPNLHIARKVSNGRFAIAGGQSGLEVSWQLTGVRKDAWARANPLEVEKGKSLHEQGYYLYPELHGEPKEKSIEWAQHPDIMRRLQKEGQNP